MIVKPIEINWQPTLSIFAKESFLAAVSDEYGWLGGFSRSGELRCFLPYTIVRRAIFRLARFRVETIPIAEGFTVAEEKSFLDKAMDFFRSRGIDMVIPATTNAVFRTFPEGAEAAPYGTYVIDLSLPEEALWKNVAKVCRRNIGSAIKSGVIIRTGLEYVDVSHRLVRETFRRSRLPFMSLAAYRRYVAGLGDYARLLVAEHQGTIQSSTLFAFSDPCVFAVYGGNLGKIPQGTMKLIQWEGIRLFQKLGVKRFDFFGARINPACGSKQEAINSFKRHFGATLVQGYIWKFPFRPLKYRLYQLASRLRSGGDIVDAERQKLKDFAPREKS